VQTSKMLHEVQWMKSASESSEARMMHSIACKSWLPNFFTVYVLEICFWLTCFQNAKEILCLQQRSIYSQNVEQYGLQ
jgi:hypothetical protein